VAIRWARPAQIDLERARAWARESSPAAARELVARIRKGVGHLRAHPRIGQRLEDIPLRGEYRALLVAPHRVVYRVEPDGNILILRIWDTRRDPDTLWPHVAPGTEGEKG
jgi:plasmid stabilization system protein ParE